MQYIKYLKTLSLRDLADIADIGMFREPGAALQEAMRRAESSKEGGLGSSLCNFASVFENAAVAPTVTASAASVKFEICAALTPAQARLVESAIRDQPLIGHYLVAVVGDLLRLDMVKSDVPEVRERADRGPLASAMLACELASFSGGMFLPQSAVHVRRPDVKDTTYLCLLKLPRKNIGSAQGTALAVTCFEGVRVLRDSCWGLPESFMVWFLQRPEDSTRYFDFATALSRVYDGPDVKDTSNTKAWAKMLLGVWPAVKPPQGLLVQEDTFVSCKSHEDKLLLVLAWDPYLFTNSVRAVRQMVRASQVYPGEVQVVDSTCISSNQVVQPFAV